MVQATENATLECDIQPPDITDTPVGELVLRVCGPTRQGQIVRLRSRKCTIGSSPNCTLRLNARGVQPVHCLIARGSGATVIRCWNSDTRINGRSFADANLHFGDHLTIGPIEFEVLNTGTDAMPSEEETDEHSRQEQVEVDNGQPDLRRRADDLDAKTVELERRIEALSLDQEQFETQTREFNQEQELLCEQTETLRRDRERVDTETENLRQERERLDAEAETLCKQREDWESERGENESQSSENNSLLEQGQQDLESKRAEFERQAEQWQNERESEQQRLRQATETIEPRIVELEQQKETLQREREEWDTRRHESEQRLSEQSEDLDRREASLMDQRMELDEARTAWETRRQTEEVSLYETEPPGKASDEASNVSLDMVDPFGEDQDNLSQKLEELSTESPTNLGNTLERMGVNLVDDDEPHPEETQPTNQPQNEISPQHTGAGRSEPAEDNGEVQDDGEESLDAYMARLMDRVHDVSKASDAPATSTPSSARRSGVKPKPATSQADNAKSRTSQSAQAADSAKPVPEKKLESISPRGVAAERAMNLSSMRELANVSAHTAINRHAKRQYRHAARSKLLVAGIGLVSGAILMLIWWLIGDHGPFFYAGMIAFTITLFWGFQFAVMSGKVIATNMDAKRLARIMAENEEHDGSEQEAADDKSG